MPLAPGTQLGPYEVVAPLGAGGMGEVWRARDRKLNREVALKVLPEAFLRDPDRLVRFKREAQVLASLNHPNIAAIYGFEESDGAQALVLELVDGPTLADRIAEGPIPLDDSIPIARQIGEALGAAHEAGVIHRDLKPANIKLRPDGTVKVLDFGLAKAMEPPAGSAEASPYGLSQSPTITTPAVSGIGVILGTAAYMSPEQAKGRPADKRSDVWAFGCVLYEMLTGARAFEGEDVSETLAFVLTRVPDWTLLPATVPPAMRTLLARCLERDRRRRIADVSTIAFVLDDVAAQPVSSRAGSEGISGSPQVQVDAAVGRMRRDLIRRQLLSVVAAVLITALLAGVGVWKLRPSAPPPAVARFALAIPDSQQITITTRHFVAISPDGAQLAYVANNRLFLRSLSEFEAHAIPGSDIFGTQIHTPVFSPDGRSLAFYVGDNTVKRIAVSGGAAVTVCPADNLIGMTWDSSWLIFGQTGKGVLRCSDGGGTPELIATVKNGEFATAPQMLPGADALLFTIANVADGAEWWDKAKVVVQSLASGKRKTLIEGASDARYLRSGHLLYALGGIMFAVPFDLARLEVTGGRVPVVEGVRRAPGGSTGVAQLATSLTGALLYFPGPTRTNAAERSLALADRAGVVTRLAVPAGPFVHLRASRDGTRLAVGSDDGKEAFVSIYRLDGTSALQRLTNKGQNRFPIWSGDGQRVAFQSDREGDLAIFAERADGTGPVERLTKPEQGDAHVPESWSPDGKHLSFSVLKGSTFSLWTLSVDDKKPTPYGGVKSVEPIASVFSPDGRWIAYGSSAALGGASPNRGVYIQPFPATGAVYQLPRQRLDFHPVWSSGGHELIYVTSSASGQLASVSVTTQPSVTFGTPAILPARVTASRPSGQPRASDILPDGRFIGLVGAAEPESSRTSAAPEIRVVLNWFEELKQRVPSK